MKTEILDYMLVLRKGIDKWEYAEELTERYDGKFAFIASKTNGENFTGVLTPAAGMIFKNGNFVRPASLAYGDNIYGRKNVPVKVPIIQPIAEARQFL